MNIKIYFLINLLMLLVISHEQIIAQQLTKASRAIPEGVEVIKDVPYVSYPDRNLLLDIYKPAEWADGQLPTILVIRGGSWAKGDKKGYGPIAAALALRGFAAVCLEYRTSDEALFPGAILDTKSAIKWIKSNANKYNFNASSIGAIGGSSGAHLAAMLGVTSKAELLNPNGNKDNLTIQAVVGLATLTDLGKMSEKNSIKTWLGKPYQTNEELWESASPISYIDKDSPPMLLIHSSNDDLVPYEQSILAIEKLAKMGVHSELILVPDAPHGFWGFEEWYGYTIDKAASFFQQQLKH